MRDGRSRVSGAAPDDGLEINLDRRCERMIPYSRVERPRSLHVDLFRRGGLSDLRFFAGTIDARGVNDVLLAAFGIPRSGFRHADHTCRRGSGVRPFRP
ncbi:hypothetical protein NOVOSPHI9U_10606 [Novosphingobium sp. 9U]|nr:hypothetical protein NOVOSPHI9U_10606 [Novosphingobium sp. 9U]